MLRRILRLISTSGSLLSGVTGSDRSPLSPGEKAPDMPLLDENGQEQRLSDYRGKPVLVYFYPKDNTPGCTKEACAFRDAWKRYEEAGVAVLGVSADSVASHKKFKEKHHLPFSLLADTEKELGKAFGLKTRMGFMPRVSFLLDEEGVIREVYPDVDPGVHAGDVLDDAERLGLTN